MIKRGRVATTVLGVGLVVLMTQFQNCASAPAVEIDTPEEALSLSAQAPDLAFSQTQFIASDIASRVQLDGICSSAHDGAEIEWSLLTNESSDRPVETGKAVCELGRFHVQVLLSEKVDCDLEHVVVAMAGWGSTSRSHLTKRCQPLASQKISPDLHGKNEPQIECNLDYNIDSQRLGARLCEKVCYQNNRLVSLQVLPQQECQSLASILSGQ